ncbi:hypothetical protein TRFO_20076 [Tritrichomonas foetus]|uniref:Sulfatase N-terminal domain-containing protein n=1 Tax=Tritrichomonas foetus TaxID=1144522 RepID=A0A1J4KLB1_9EUKA|nr:hypothetical protein TRFO_20076 [Tritrichomonas foetus]|eukprot:OHT10580.1 hypothetical protein TRFO_20076 [Tritrichomonas foetus]
MRNRTTKSKLNDTQRSIFQIPFYELLLYISLFLILEVVQIYYNQTFLLFLSHLILFSSVLIVSYSVGHPKITCFILILYECLETGSWVTVGTNITFQTITAIDLVYVYHSHPEFFLIALFVVILIFLFFHIPLPSQIINVTYSLNYILIIIIFSLLYIFSLSVYHSLYPFNEMVFSLNNLSPSESRVARMISDLPKLIFSPKKPKNVILFQFESFERGPIGEYNSRYPESMPFLSNLARNTTIFDNLESQPYTTWTAAGSFVTQCSFPQVINDPLYWDNRKHSHLTQWNKLPCMPTFFKLAGYNMYSYMVGSTKIMGLKQFMKDKGYSTFDVHEHGLKRDYPLIQKVQNSILPELVKEKQPFVLHMMNEDTHPMYYTDPICSNKNFPTGKNIPPVISSFNCVDQMLENFTKKAIELGLNDDNILYVIYGDHISYGDKTGIYDNRKLVNIFPFKPKNQNSKPGTYYDFAPTILKQLNISYKPEFAFGDDLFSDRIGTFPNVSEFQFIYGMYAKQMHRSSEIKCKDKVGFCTGYM